MLKKILITLVGATVLSACSSVDATKQYDFVYQIDNTNICFSHSVDISELSMTEKSHQVDCSIYRVDEIVTYSGDVDSQHYGILINGESSLRYYPETTVAVETKNVGDTYYISKIEETTHLDSVIVRNGSYYNPITGICFTVIDDFSWERKCVANNN